MKQLLYLFVASILIAASCQRQNNNPAKYYIRCLIDGQEYIPNGCANCMKGQLLGDTVFMMNANAGFESLIIGVINKPNFIKNTYLLDRVSSGGSYDNSPLVNDIFKTDSINTGKLTITSLDKANKIIEGSFYFKAYNPIQNKIVNVTNGEFRLLYTTN